MYNPSLISRPSATQRDTTLAVLTAGEHTYVEKLSFFAVVLFLASQAWGIPLLYVPGISWSLWPTPGDFVWLLLFPVATLLILRNHSWRSKARSSVLNAMYLFVVYCLVFYVLGYIYSPFPTSQFNYFAYNLFRILQATTVWLVASQVPLNGIYEQRIWQVVYLSGLVVGIAAILQQFGLIDYRWFVTHLPSDPTIAGPWALRTYAPLDAALGTLNYNRIFTGQFLASLLVIAIVARNLSFSSLLLIAVLLAGMVSTQSRTAVLTLLISLAYACLRAPRVRVNVLIVGTIVVVCLLVLLPITLDHVKNTAILSRDDTLVESLDGRLERQWAGVWVATKDLWTTFFGVGFGNLGYYWLGQGFSPAHGQYATAFAELGIAGLGLLLFLYARLFQSVGLASYNGLAVKSLLFGLIICAMFNDYLLPSPAFGTFLPWLFCLSGLYLEGATT